MTTEIFDNNWVSVAVATKEDADRIITAHANSRLRQWLWRRLEELAMDDAALEVEAEKRRAEIGIAPGIRVGYEFATGFLVVHPDEFPRCGLPRLESK